MASAIDWKEFVAWQGVSKLLETVFVVYVSPHFFFFFFSRDDYIFLPASHFVLSILID